MTITSILEAMMTDDERENTTVVVFLADFETKQTQLLELITMFKEYMAMGVLQIIQAPSDYYEPLRDLHRSLGINNEYTVQYV